MKIVKPYTRSVLVQKTDIKMLIKLGVMVPSHIFSPFLTQNETITSKNQYDFVEFSEEEVIYFFQSQDWLLDYVLLSNFSEEELSIAISILEKDLSDIKEEILQVDDKDKLSSYQIEIMKINHKLEGLNYLKLNLIKKRKNK